MARKNVARPVRLATAQSLAASFQTVPTTIEFLDSVAYSVSTTGLTDNTGAFTIEVRNVFSDGTATEWVPLSFSPAIELLNANVKLWIEATVTASQSRLSFVAAGGTPDGSAVISVIAKQIGG